MNTFSMKNWLEAVIPSMTLAQAQVRYWNGHWTALQWSAFKEVWTWSAMRHGDQAGMKHDLFLGRYGFEAYYARINKTRKAFGLQPYSR